MVLCEASRKRIRLKEEVTVSCVFGNGNLLVEKFTQNQRVLSTGHNF